MLIWDKFSSQASLTPEAIKSLIDDEVTKNKEPIEVMIEEKITGSGIDIVVIKKEDYKYFTSELNMRRIENGKLDPKEEELFTTFIALQNELRRRGIDLIRV
jgi:hypothetical protein